MPADETPAQPVEGGHVWQPAPPRGLDQCRCGTIRGAYYASDARRPCPLARDADEPTTCTAASCGATRAEYDRDPCTRQVCPMRDGQPDTDPMPVFTIKAKDKLAVRAVAAYLRLCEESGLSDQAAEVELAMAEIDSWRRRHPERVKLPDHAHVPAVQRDVAATELDDLAEAEARGHRAGREAAAQAIRDRANTIDIEPNRVGPRATLRRHMWTAARIAAGPPTPAEVVAAVEAGQAIVCRTRDIEPGGGGEG